jgi:hypothetical protein
MNSTKIRYGWIYVLRCVINDKEYVGQTIERRAEIRWRAHVRSAFVAKVKRPLYASMRMYGLENFVGEVLWYGPESKLNSFERKFIRERKTCIDDGWGFNLTRGGQDNPVPSAYTRKKMARIARKRMLDPIIRAATIACLPTSADLKRLWKNEIYRECTLSGLRSSSVRSKMSGKMTEAWERPAYRKSMIVSFNTEESKRRRAEGAKFGWAHQTTAQRTARIQKTVDGNARAWERLTPSERLVRTDKRTAWTHDPEKTARANAKRKAKWDAKSDEDRAMLTKLRLERSNTPAARKLRADKVKAAWNSEGYRENQSSKHKGVPWSSARRAATSPPRSTMEALSR